MVFRIVAMVIRIVAMVIRIVAMVIRRHMIHFFIAIYMDTRIWGPGGWKLLHSIAEDTTTTLRWKIKLTKTLHKILPCVYCRDSFAIYEKQLGLNMDCDDFSKTMYRIHNKVNLKLEKQGYVVRRASSYQSVQKRYQTLNQRLESTNCDDLGYLFIGCVVFNYPSTNPSKELSKQYASFFQALSRTYPVRSVRRILKAYHKENPIEGSLKSRSSLIKWFSKYPIKRINTLKKRELIDLFDSFRAGCSTKSCRNRGKKKATHL